jgi:hypothetical protein
MPGAVAQELIATYAFKGPGVELDRTLPLHENEHSIIAGRIATRYRGHGVIANRAGFLRLSTEHLCIVLVYGFRRDRILEIPRAAVVKVDEERPPIRIRFSSLHGGEQIDIVRAAEVGPTDSRGTVRQTTVDVLEFFGGGNRSSFEKIGAILDAWMAAAT